MFKHRYTAVLFTVALLVVSFAEKLSAEINFDFALPLFKQEEVNFEKTKTTDYNFQLLKKYVLEHENNVIAQFHAINRWFTLMKLSDTPRHDELLKVANKYFSTKNVKKPTTEEKLREIFYTGLLLQSNKSEDPENKLDQEFEELLLDSEEELAENANYWIAKGILFHALQNRPNNYFRLMKPEEDLKIALTFIPKTAQYYYVLGQCFRYLGNSDSSLFLSIASYEKSASLDPRNSKLQNSLLSIYMGLHEEYQAKGKQEPFWLEEAVYKKILEMSPGNPHALNNLGYLYAEYGVNTQTAQELCQRAVDLSPENPGFYDSLGWAAFKNKDLQLAEESLLKSISMRDNVYESHYHLATMYYATNKLDKAAKQYEAAIKIRPDSAETLNNLAYLYTEQNTNVQEALKMAITVNQLEPNNATYLDTLGWAYYRNGDLENALSNLLKANNLVPGEGEILLHIGRVYLDKNEFSTALTYVKEAFKASPGLSDPDETLYLTIRLKAYHEAMADYHGLLGEKADKTKVLNILMGIARLYQEEGLFDKSIEINQICSALKNGTKTLKEPLLNSYKMHSSALPSVDEKQEKIQNEIENTPKEATELDSELDEEEAVLEEDEETNSNESSESNDKQSVVPNEASNTNSEDNNLITLPEVVPVPIAIAFCSDLSEQISPFIPKMSGYRNLNITVFVDRFLFPQATAIIRIESKSQKGEELLSILKKKFGCCLNKSENEVQENKIHIFSGVYNTFCLKNAVYISKQELPTEIVSKLSQVLPYRDGYILETYIDWSEIKKRIPQLLCGFISNPIHPFLRVHTSYSYDNKTDSLNEFTVATTGKEESEKLLKDLARSLFMLKLQAKQSNLSMTIKMQQDKDLIYISTDFEQILTWLSQKVDLLNGNIKRIIPLLIPAHK